MGISRDEGFALDSSGEGSLDLRSLLWEDAVEISSILGKSLGIPLYIMEGPEGDGSRFWITGDGENPWIGSWDPDQGKIVLSD